MGESWSRSDVHRRQFLESQCVRSVLTTSVKILPYRPPARLIKCLLHGKQEKFNSFNVTGLYYELLFTNLYYELTTEVTRSSQLCTKLKQLWNESLKKIQAWTGFDSCTASVSQRLCVRIPFGPEFFFRLYVHNCLSCVHNCDDQSCLYKDLMKWFEPRNMSSSYSVIVRMRVVLNRSTLIRTTSGHVVELTFRQREQRSSSESSHYIHWLDSQDDFCSGGRNVSHQQQFFSELLTQTIILYELKIKYITPFCS